MGRFRDFRILVVEDEPLIGLDVAHSLKDAGYEVVGPIRSVEAAVRSIARQPPAMAVLDLNLGNETTVHVADVLEGIRVPFVWLSGYSRDIIPVKHRGRPYISKPFSPATLLGILAAAQTSAYVPA